MKKRIGITCGRLFEGDAYTYQIRAKYFERILAAGGIPVLQTGEEGIDELDGLLLSGGGDCTMACGNYAADADEAKLRDTDPWRDAVEGRILRLPFS